MYPNVSCNLCHFVTMEIVGPLGNLPDVTTVQNRINSSFDNLFHYSNTGQRHAFVCTFCDKYIINVHDRQYVSVDWLRDNRRIFLWSENITNPSEFESLKPLIDIYTFHNIDNYIADKEWLQGLCLSPRGVIGRPTERSKFGFSCCSKCRNWLRLKKLPFYAIVNRNFVGNALECLTR
jgi:hypothetical protein